MVVVERAGDYPRDGNQGGTRRPKIVVVGGRPGTADVALPREFAPRELRLACTLLAEVRRVEHQCELLAHHDREARQLAQTDPLTALANRRAWDQQVQEFCRQAVEDPSRGYWLAIADLDHFKQVNDVRGYAAGDRALKLAAQTLSNHLRRGDLLARLGGDEFGIVLARLDETQARMVLERLATALALLAESDCTLHVSIGYAPLDAAGDGTAFSLAERGLRAAKQGGGNCVVAGHRLPAGGEA